MTILCMCDGFCVCDKERQERRLEMRLLAIVRHGSDQTALMSFGIRGALSRAP